jgi:undecaprenyl-diphosphatase
LVTWIAQYLLFGLAAVFAAVWLFAEDRRGKIELAASAAVGVGLMFAFLVIAQHVHHDPRPFVADPHIKPFFSHSRDDGFPSDHSIAAALIAGLVIWRHRVVGAVLALGAIAIAWARVAAHVHHAQDVVAGLLLGALAAAIAWAIVPPLLTRFARTRLPASRDGRSAV